MDGLIRIAKYLFQLLGIMDKVHLEMEKINTGQEKVIALLQEILGQKTPDEILNLDQAAQLLNVTPRTIRNRRNKGRIQPIAGSDNYYLKSELLKTSNENRD